MSWDPRENDGWGVVFYPDPARPELGDGPFAFASAEGSSVETLLDLVRCVVRAGARRLALDGLERSAARGVPRREPGEPDRREARQSGPQGRTRRR